ncbi:hypothetical protein U9M48_027963 [Paspalum notatum var. saurae]|uniref:Uncharacterized protein n=1 Tax=Paspalum notatum var. saurae TaxID=547442 RepID=A0AAQ3TVU6_PASNO
MPSLTHVYLDIETIEPFPGTRVRITQMRKAGTIGLSYASMKAYWNDGVGLHRTHTRYHQVGLPTKTAWDKTPSKVERWIRDVAGRPLVMAGRPTSWAVLDLEASWAPLVAGRPRKVASRPW